VAVYFLRGHLPWQNIKAKTIKEKYDKIKEKKINTTIDEVTNGLPEEFNTYLTYVRNLDFTQTPDYNYLR